MIPTDPAAPIRVLLVDDQELLRRGLAMLLSTVDGLQLVAEAADGHDALTQMEAAAPDVVVTDARMPGMDGVQLTAALQETHPQLPVLVLTTFDDDELVRGAIAAGASGFLLKDTSTDALADAIRAVRTGGMVIDPRVARAAFGQQRGAPATAPPSAAPTASAASPTSEHPDELALLTPTERQVAGLLAEGRSNGEIAAALHLAEGTVKNHVSALLRKTGSRDRTALALLLVRALGL